MVDNFQAAWLPQYRDGEVLLQLLNYEGDVLVFTNLAVYRMQVSDYDGQPVLRRLL